MEQTIIIPPVLQLWKISIEQLDSNGTQHIEYVGSRYCSKFRVVQEIKTRFTPEWWNDHLIIAVEEIGRLVMINGTALYEED